MSAVDQKPVTRDLDDVIARIPRLELLGRPECVTQTDGIMVLAFPFDDDGEPRVDHLAHVERYRLAAVLRDILRRLTPPVGPNISAHINHEGKFQSDKYPDCPAGKVPLSVEDRTAQDLLWRYAQRRRAVDAEFSADLETCLRAAGYEPTGVMPEPVT